MPRVSFWPNPQSWQRYWPSGIMALIAVIQLFISFIILGIQIAIVIIGTIALCNSVTPRYVMGFVCWAFFFACWISIFCVTCCNRSSVCCATYTLVKNILAFVFSAVLIDFDRKFIDNPLFDYNPSVNSAFYYTESCDILDNNSVDYWGISQSLSKGQLAGAVIILVTSLVFVGIYIYVYIRASKDDGRMPTDMFVNHNRTVPSHPPVYVTPQPQMPVQAQPKLYTPGTVLCERCGAAVDSSQRF